MEVLNELSLEISLKDNQIQKAEGSLSLNQVIRDNVTFSLEVSSDTITLPNLEGYEEVDELRL